MDLPKKVFEDLIQACDEDYRKVALRIHGDCRICDTYMGGLNIFNMTSYACNKRHYDSYTQAYDTVLRKLEDHIDQAKRGQP